MRQCYQPQAPSDQQAAATNQPPRPPSQQQQQQQQQQFNVHYAQQLAAGQPEELLERLQPFPLSELKSPSAGDAAQNSRGFHPSQRRTSADSSPPVTTISERQQCADRKMKIASRLDFLTDHHERDRIQQHQIFAGHHEHAAGQLVDWSAPAHLQSSEAGQYEAFSAVITTEDYNCKPEVSGSPRAQDKRPAACYRSSYEPVGQQRVAANDYNNNQGDDFQRRQQQLSYGSLAASTPHQRADERSDFYSEVSYANATNETASQAPDCNGFAPVSVSNQQQQQQQRYSNGAHESATNATNSSSPEFVVSSTSSPPTSNGVGQMYAATYDCEPPQTNEAGKQQSYQAQSYHQPQQQNLFDMPSNYVELRPTSQQQDEQQFQDYYSNYSECDLQPQLQQSHEDNETSGMNCYESKAQQRDVRQYQHMDMNGKQMQPSEMYSYDPFADYNSHHYHLNTPDPYNPAYQSHVTTTSSSCNSSSSSSSSTSSSASSTSSLSLPAGRHVGGSCNSLADNYGVLRLDLNESHRQQTQASLVTSASRQNTNAATPIPTTTSAPAKCTAASGPGRPRSSRGRPRKKKSKAKGKVSGKLWEFIRDLLLNECTNPSFIRWERREDGVFKFVQSDKVAKMWGERKQNPKMTYEKLSRAMRYYYKSKVLLPVFGRRLVYKFGPNATGWMSAVQQQQHNALMQQQQEQQRHQMQQQQQQQQQQPPVQTQVAPSQLLNDQHFHVRDFY